MMERQSPFTAGQRGAIPKDENSARFALLKPVCVQLLSHTSAQANTAKPESQRNDDIVKILDRLLALLESFKSNPTPLSASLISYVFFPIAQLLRTSSDLPDRIQRLQFAILARLTTDWWRAWAGVGKEASEQWKVWEQLLMLGAVSLFKQGGKDKGASEETSLAILELLQSLLSPRLATRRLQKSDTKAARTSVNWEWDGESELPDLDDYESEMQRLSLESKETPESATNEDILVYPSDSHLSYTYDSPASRGALAHTLSVSLDLGKSAKQTRATRSASLRLARALLHVWTAGSADDLSDLSMTIDMGSEELASLDGAFRDRGQQFEAKEIAKRMATILPGVVSTSMRILTAKKIQSQIASEAVELLRLVLTTSLSDAVVATRDIGLASSGANLEDLFARVVDSDAEEVQNSAPELSPSVDDEMGKGNDNGGSDLRETMSRVAIALQGIDGSATLTLDASSVRYALARLAGELLEHCWYACGQGASESVNTRSLLFRWLLDIASDETNSLRTTTKATSHIVGIAKHRQEFVRDEIIDMAKALPRLFTLVKQDEQLQRMSGRLSFLIRIASGAVDGSVEGLALQDLFSASVYERWIFSLVGSFTLEHMSTSIGDAGFVRLEGFEVKTSKSVMRMFEEVGAASARLQGKRKDGKSSKSIVGYLLDLCARWRPIANAGQSRHQRHKASMCLVAAMIGQCLMKGVEAVLDDARLALQQGSDAALLRKQSKRFARQIMATITEIWQMDEDDLLHGDMKGQKAVGWTEEEKQLMEAHSDPISRLTGYQRGLQKETQEDQSDVGKTQLTSSLPLDLLRSATSTTQPSQLQNLPISTVRERNQQQVTWQARQIDVFLLSMLASAATILGPTVKPLLVQTIYPIISALASTSEEVHTAASTVVEKIAFAAGYASIQGCMLDHADYILGSASHRLVSNLGQELQRRTSQNERQTSTKSFAADQGLLPLTKATRSLENTYLPLMSAMSAPLVLLELIRSLGSEVVALIEDAIDEVLDAIDRFHGDDEICDNLLSVLDRMLEVMLEQEQQSASDEEPPVQDLKRLRSDLQTVNQRAIEELNSWMKEQAEKDTTVKEDADTTFDTLESELANQPQVDTASAGESVEKTITRTQEVTVSMLKKAVPFLSHSSRAIRMRSLRLLNRGIEILCRQGLKEEPLSVVSISWPIVMSRLGFSLSRPLKQLRRSAAASQRAADGMDEKDFFVAIEAVKLVSTLSQFLVDYLGNEKMLRQAVPRVLLLLSIVEQAESTLPRSEQRRETTTFLLQHEEKSTSISSLPNAASVDDPLATKSNVFRPFRSHSPLAIVLEQTLLLLDRLVRAMGDSITEADLFTFAQHPSILNCLDVRQSPPLLSLARRFYHETLAERNGPLVWLIVQGAKGAHHSEAGSKSNGSPHCHFPSFLARPELSL